MSNKSKFLYVLLFVIFIIYPHFIKGHILFVPQAFVESLVNIILLIFLYVLYIMHSNDIKNKNNEKSLIESKLGKTSSELIESFNYIAKLNRRMPLISEITSNLIKNNSLNVDDKKNILNNLLATATVSVAKVDWGIFRFIDTTSTKTIKEFRLKEINNIELNNKISNREIINRNSNKNQPKVFDDYCIVRSSDKVEKVQCFLFLPKSQHYTSDVFSLLQNIVDQGQLFYQYLYRV